VSVKVDGQDLVDQTFDLCDSLEASNLECPISSGVHELKIDETIPDFIPSVSLQNY